MTELPKMTRKRSDYDGTYWEFEENGHTFRLTKTRNWTGSGQRYRTAWYISTTDGEFSAQGGRATGPCSGEDKEDLIRYAIAKTR